jgi:hypothetical protein
MNETNELKEKIVELLDDDVDFDSIVSELYNDESNYNNADKTSGQVVFTEAELQSEVDKVLEWARLQEDRCSECGKIVTEEDYITEQNLCTSDPYPIYENIVVGYLCTCGHRESY